MKTIGINQFKEIVMDCLDNPDKYATGSIILWNSHSGPDSIEYQVVEECCVDYNKMHTDNQVWFKYLSALSTEGSYYISTSKVICDREDMYGWKNRGILLDGGIVNFSKSSDEEIAQWLNLVNYHEYQGKILSSDWTMIACAQARYYGLTEDMFSKDCILYVIKPSVDEWAEWMKDKCDEKDLNPIVAFIKKTGSPIDLFYWGIALSALESRMVKNDYDVLSQLSQKEFDSCLRETLGFRLKGFPYDELWQFIQEYQK